MKAAGDPTTDAVSLAPRAAARVHAGGWRLAA